ncbi:hypothetical protein [Nocardia noduli]|uniref:hypothetical protein n=1 Tax=Nocardia noduli TaxID=2815722 RepID=UPI001C250581|nr:hypothetical protein [Nocardia noduli]
METLIHDAMPSLPAIPRLVVRMWYVMEQSKNRMAYQSNEAFPPDVAFRHPHYQRCV